MNATTKRMEEILMSPYSTDNYVELINEIFSTVWMIAPDILHEERSNFSYHIAGSTHVGTYNTPDGKLLLIFAVKLQKQSGIERARSMQRNFAKKLIESGNADAALVAFYAEDDPKWRLSFVRLDYEMKIENGKLKATEKLTPAKRYSFLVGDKEPCHTALSHFHSFIVDNNSNPTLDELEEAFSVERVTQEFFDLYCEKYQQLREWLLSNEDFAAESERCHFTVEQFAKKLLGQIVFLYFLQKKGWLGVGVWPHMLTEKEYKNLFFTTGAQGRIIKEYLPALYVQSGENYIQTSRFRSALDRIPDDVEELIANGKQYEAAMEEAASYISGLFSDLSGNIADAMIDAFQKTGNAAINTGDIISDVAKNFAKSWIENKLLEDIFNEKAQDRMFALMEKGDTEGALDYLSGLIGEANALAPQITEYLRGLDGLATEIEEPEQERTSTAKGIAQASQDSVDENNARLTTIQGHTYSISADMKVLVSASAMMLDRLAAIETNTARLENIESGIAQMRSDISYMNTKGLFLRK